MDATTLRIILAIIGAIVLGLIYWTGSRGAPQSRRTSTRGDARSEPSIESGSAGRTRDLDPDLLAELERMDREMRGDLPKPQEGSRNLSSGGDLSGHHEAREPVFQFDAFDAAPEPDRHGAFAAPAEFDEAPAFVDAKAIDSGADVRMPPASDLGRRHSERSDRIVTLHVAAGLGRMFQGADILSAAEKTGLVYGSLGIFHRLPSQPHGLGAVFSVANMLQPGRFDADSIQALRTSGLTLFLMLPNAVSALDAWDAMLPTAQRFAELLDGQVLDEDRHPLARSRTQQIREEMRAYDRAQEKNTIRKTW